MRAFKKTSLHLLVLGCCLHPVAGAQAQAGMPDLEGICGASSSYDLSLDGQRLLFERAAPAPQRLELAPDGALEVDGVAARLNLEDRDRLALISTRVHALVPEVRALARRAVDLAVEAVREQAAATTGRGDAELDRVLEARRRELHARIDASRSTRDWQGDAFERDMQAIVAEIVPLVAAGLGERALAAAMSGDLAAAGRLRQDMVGLQGALEARLGAKLAQLEPEARGLCPRLEEIDRLESGLSVRPAGRPFDLVHIDRAAVR
ncbi:DUF2884 family protein [Coralloluteibacterium thermophilus]|uniref:DUF2884 family protein n=1 Tax=Coralloluteibacterium thermophilum TaxID=2707049 RepID=A0ABV9NL69_9GAMM